MAFDNPSLFEMLVSSWLKVLTELVIFSQCCSFFTDSLTTLHAFILACTVVAAAFILITFLYCLKVLCLGKYY